MKITVKTLDSKNEEFDLSDEVTVQELKEKIAEKMEITLDKQRLIFQGKVLKDDKQLKEYGIGDDKVIHLVQNAPPAGEGEATEQTDSEARPAGGQRSQQDLVFVSAMPMVPGGNIAQMTQNIVDNIVGTLNATGQTASVSAHARTVDAEGHTRESVHSSATASGVISGTVPAAPPPASTTPPPTTTTTTAPSQPPQEQGPPPITMTMQLPTMTTSEERSRMRRSAEDRRREYERRIQDRTRRQLRDIHRHMKSSRRCLDFAKKILDRHDKAEERRRTKEREAREREEREARGEEEPMEVSSTEQEAAKDKEEEKPPSSEPGGEEGEPEASEMEPVSASQYADLLEEAKNLQARAQPLIDAYQSMIREEKDLEDKDSIPSQRIALTVKDFNYYIGHAYAAMSRLHVGLTFHPPRTVKVVPPRRTEMRRVLQQLRAMPPRAPPGYIIDIEQNQESEDSSEAAASGPTLAQARRSMGLGPFGFGPLSGFGMGASFMPESDDEEEDEEEAPHRTIGIDISTTGGSQEHTFNTGDSAPETKTIPVQQPPPSLLEDRPSSSKPTAESKKEETEETSEAKDGEPKDGEPKDGEPKEKKDGEPKDGEPKDGEPKDGEPKDGEPKEKKDGEPKDGEPKDGEPKEKKEGDEDDSDDDDDDNPQDLARILSQLISGMVDNIGQDMAADEEAEREGRRPEGEGGEERPRENAGDENEGERPVSFVDRYAGPEGTTVTIQQAPQPPFGIPGLPPVPGPSISIRNPGGGQRPQLSINFPTPPALTLLQNILQRRQEEREAERELEKEKKDGDQEGASGSAEPAKPPPKKEPPKREEPPADPFAGEDDIESISDAGSLDSIDSDHEEPPEVEHPMSRIATAAMEDHYTGQRHTMHETINELRDEYGATLDIGEEELNDGNQGIVEDLLQMISRVLTVIEVMSVFRGTKEPIQQLQSPLICFIQEKLTNGEDPSPERRDMAVTAFLRGCVDGIKACLDKLPLCEGVDFPMTCYNTLTSILKRGYELIISKHTGEHGFAEAMHQWATTSSGLFGSVIRQCSKDNDDFDVVIKELLGVMFPPSTPQMILSMCSDSILNEMRRLKDNVTFSPEQLQEYVVYEEGFTPRPVSEAAMDGGETSAEATGQSDNHVSSSEGTTSEKWPQGMPKDWIPVIKRDREAMSQMGPQQPFSDAYLAGMPTKKRKQLESGEAETCTTEEMFSSTLQTAITTAGATPTSGASVEAVVTEATQESDLPQGMGEELFAGVKERLENDPDYQPERYPNAQQFYKPNK